MSMPRRAEPIPLSALMTVFVEPGVRNDNRGENPSSSTSTLNPFVDPIITPVVVDRDVARRKARFLNRFRANILTRPPDSIAPWASIGGRMRLNDEVLPIYIETPFAMPSRELPWVVNVPPQYHIEVDLRVEIAVLGECTVVGLVEDDLNNDHCVFMLKTLHDGSVFYLAVPRAWTSMPPVVTTEEEKVPRSMKRSRSFWDLLCGRRE